jgi:hypothetical protein
VSNSEPSKTSLAIKKSPINSKASSIPNQIVVPESSEAPEDPILQESKDHVSETMLSPLSMEKEASLKEASIPKPVSIDEKPLSLNESKERSATSSPRNDPATVLSLSSIVSEHEISQEVINALSEVSRDASETSHTSSRYRLESTVLVVPRNTAINTPIDSGPHVAFEGFGDIKSQAESEDDNRSVIGAGSRTENVGAENNPEDEEMVSYSKKYQKMKYEIEMQNFWIDKMNRDLNWKIQQKRPGGEIQRLEKKVATEVQKAKEMVEFAEAMQRRNPSDKWGPIPLTPIAEESIDQRALVPPMVPSDTSNLSGFEQLNEIKTDRDEYVNLLQNEIDSKEDHIKELNEKLKEAHQNLMLLSEKRESLSQSPSQSSAAKALRKTQNEEELMKNIEAIRSVDEMMKILMDKIQSIKELAKTLQEEIDWLRIKNFEIMDRELYLKENL